MPATATLTVERAQVDDAGRAIVMMMDAGWPTWLQHSDGTGWLKGLTLNLNLAADLALAPNDTADRVSARLQTVGGGGGIDYARISTRRRKRAP